MEIGWRLKSRWMGTKIMRYVTFIQLAQGSVHKKNIQNQTGDAVNELNRHGTNWTLFRNADWWEIFLETYSSRTEMMKLWLWKQRERRQNFDDWIFLTQYVWLDKRLVSHYEAYKMGQQKKCMNDSCKVALVLFHVQHNSIRTSTK